MALLDIEDGFWALRRQLEALVGRRLADTVLQQAGANGGASFARNFIGRPPATDCAQVLRDCIAAYQAAGFGRFEVEVLAWPLGRAIVHGADTFEAWMVRQHGQTTSDPVCAYTAGVLVGFVNVLSERHDVVCVERACQAQGEETCLFELIPADQATGATVVSFDPDPSLSHQLNLLEILFDRMPMGIAIFDRELKLRRCNPTWAAFIGSYTKTQVSQVAPGVNIFDLEPGTEQTLMPLFEHVFAGETVRQEAIRLETGGIVSYWDVVLTPLFEDGQVVGILDVSIDATQRMEAFHALKESEANFRSFLENATHFAIYRLAIDPDNPYGGKVLMVSPSLKEIVGMDDPYRFESWFENIHPDDVDRVIAANQRSVALGETYDQPVRVYHPQKEAWIWLHTISSPVFDSSGRPTYVNGIVLDITRQKLAEEQLAQQEKERIRGEQEARLAERNRLARELHDAVTQTLFSSSLIAEVLPKLWERNPDEGRRRSEELRQLTRGALAEMRTLLLELRPSALIEADPGGLFRHLVEAFTSRTRVPAQFTSEGDRDLPPDVKVVLYRIAQEALNNVSKHAGARQVTLRLLSGPDQVELSICDDGRGFDLSAIPFEHLGLGIMQERAESIGARLSITSQIGEGTEVSVIWPARESQEIV